MMLSSLARMIDHSLLHPTITDKGIVHGCHVAKKYQVASACVKPYATLMARDILAGSGVAVCAVIAFPHGNSATRIKLREADQVLGDGAVEIDMVVNIGKVLGGDWDYVSEEINRVNQVVRDHGALLKVIFENDYLEDTQIIRLCEICASHAVAFVKTSTGYGFVKQSNGMYSYGGATDYDLRLMRSHCTESVQVKAAGGVRNLEDLLRVRDLGVTRVGATATEAILEEARKRGYK
ncbi:MAG TPA: deoxyribose-phosphate aldolase [Acidobacteriota bacterium]|jgi:deoxyribose-phosphate aldolase